jgi:SNF2 family DNA or RNA helicase
MVTINYFDNNRVLTKLNDRSFDEVSYFNLQYVANSLLLKGKKEKLMVLDEIKDKITLFPHQVNASLRYLNEMEGRVVLADEVGLGKTIEAGIIIKELIAREGVSKILILTPDLNREWLPTRFRGERNTGLCDIGIIINSEQINIIRTNLPNKQLLFIFKYF